MNKNYALFFRQFHHLDYHHIEHWPLTVKVTHALAYVIILSVLGYFLLIKSQITTLQQLVNETKTLTQQQKIKSIKSDILHLLEQQIHNATLQISALKTHLSLQTKTSELLDNITEIGQKTGLTFIKLNWLPEIKHDTYNALPIDIVVIGNFHLFTEFVSQMSALPQIITLHDFTITKHNLVLTNTSQDLADHTLQLKLVAQIYQDNQERQ